MSTLRETTASNTDQTTHAVALREAMIGELREMGAIRTDRVRWRQRRDDGLVGRL